MLSTNKPIEWHVFKSAMATAEPSPSLYPTPPPPPPPVPPSSSSSTNDYSTSTKKSLKIVYAHTDRKIEKSGVS